MARRPTISSEGASDIPTTASGGKKKVSDVAMIRVNLPPDIHRRLWQLRIDTRQSIQQIVSDILAEKFAEMDK